MSNSITLKANVTPSIVSNREGESFYEIGFTLDESQLKLLGLEPINPTAVITVKKGSFEDDYEMVNHPSHYNRYPIEAVEMARRIWGDEAMETAAQITAFFYRMRLGLKPDNSVKQELNKEEFWLNYSKRIHKEIESKKVCRSDDNVMTIDHAKKGILND